MSKLAHCFLKQLLLGVLSITALLFLSFANADTASKLFKQFQHGVIQIEIVNVHTGKRSGIGSGFFISPDGFAVTNYHVIADVILEPDTYKGEFQGETGITGSLQILNVDIVNDLALIKTTVKPRAFFKLSQHDTTIGERIWAIGNPEDLGITIVEGTFSGLIHHSIYRRLHFTGSLNPGMSGGPAINAEGEVVGVNVATSGNQISYLVSSESVKKIVSTANESNAIPELLSIIRSQLLTHQKEKLHELSPTTFQVSTLGNYKVPALFSPYVRCWGDSTKESRHRYQVHSEICSVNDGIYLSYGHEPVLLQYRHDYIIGTRLNDWAFYKLYGDYFSSLDLSVSGTQNTVTNFKCETKFIANGNLTLKVAVCLRGLKNFPGIYDIVATTAVLGNDRQGLQSTLILNGVAYETGMPLVEKFTRAISWIK